MWPLQALATKHPDYTANLSKWKLCREADELSGGFAPVLTTYQPGQVPVGGDSYLIPHEREAAEDYSRRCAAARAPRFVPLGISSMVGSLTAGEVIRSNYPPKLTAWLDSCTPDITSFRTYLATRVLPLLERYGTLYLYAHTPAVEARSEQDLIDASIPAVVIDVLSPENVTAWQYDDLGDLIWVKWEEAINYLPSPDSTMAKSTTRHHYANRWGYWSVDEIALESDDQSSTVIESGYWQTNSGLGYVPVIKWVINPHATYAAALTSQEYFRVESDMRHLESSTSFSQLWVPSDQSLESVKQVVRGPNVVGKFSPESRLAPMMLTPDSGPFDHFAARLVALESDALACYGLQSGKASSGVALAHLEQIGGAQLRAHAQACESGEFATLSVVADLLGETLERDMRAKWPQEFGTLTSTLQLTDAQRLMDMKPGDAIEAAVIEKCLTIVLPGLTQAKKDMLVASLSTRVDMDNYAPRPVAGQEVTAPEPPMAAGGAGSVLDPDVMRTVE
jgi:hypothetical protein